MMRQNEQITLMNTKRTCIDFIEDISHDYEAWVDYYKLPEDEDKRRRAGIRCHNYKNK